MEKHENHVVASKATMLYTYHFKEKIKVPRNIKEYEEE